MNRKKMTPYWKMTTSELRAATKEFDEEFVEDKFRPLTAAERAQWQEIQTGLRTPAKDQNGTQVIAVRVQKKLLDRCTALAKKKRISRDALIARGLKKLLAAEREGT